MITQYKQLIHSNTFVKSLNLSYNSLKLVPFRQLYLYLILFDKKVYIIILICQLFFSHINFPYFG